MDPADPHNLDDAADHEILETIQIATAGNECDECVRKRHEPLMRIEGVKDVKADAAAGFVVITFANANPVCRPEPRHPGAILRRATSVSPEPRRR
jgi:hypothetical protein